MKQKEDTQNGFSLVEILIVLLIIPLCTEAIFWLFIGGQSFWKIENAASQAQEQARQIAVKMRRELLWAVQNTVKITDDKKELRFQTPVLNSNGTFYDDEGNLTVGTLTQNNQPKENWYSKYQLDADNSCLIKRIFNEDNVQQGSDIILASNVVDLTFQGFTWTKTGAGNWDWEFEEKNIGPETVKISITTTVRASSKLESHYTSNFQVTFRN
jgi:prepilin-type N-terminal cleavage/methylation domain-containing protein